MNYKAIIAEISQLKRSITDAEASGDVVYGCIDSSKPGGNVTGNISIQYRLRVKGEKARYIKKEELPQIQSSVARGRQIRAWGKQLAALEKQKAWLEAFAAENGLPLKNPMGDRDATPEWYTPHLYIEMARAVLGGIDLDPASCELAQGWIRAESFYTKQEDGLKSPWFGRIWCNPPYGSPEVRLLAREFLERAIAEFESGSIQSAIFLLNRSGAAWYRASRRRVTAVCEVHRRIAFIDQHGVLQKSPRYSNDFLYLGANLEQFSEVFAQVGDVQSF